MRDLEDIAYAIGRLAEAVTPTNPVPFKGPLGHEVGSLTDAIIYAADTISDAINRLEFMLEEVRDVIADLPHSLPTTEKKPPGPNSTGG